MPYTPVLATLGYVFAPDGTRVLMVRRDRNRTHYHFGKVNGLGGKLEPDEDVVAGMRREIREEAGIECTALELRGTVSWPGFGKQGEDWFGFVFRVTAFTGTPFASNAEGTLEWVEAGAAADAEPVGRRPPFLAAGVRPGRPSVPRRHAVPRRQAAVVVLFAPVTASIRIARQSVGTLGVSPPVEGRAPAG